MYIDWLLNPPNIGVHTSTAKSNPKKRNHFSGLVLCPRVCFLLVNQLLKKNQTIKKLVTTKILFTKNNIDE